MITDAEELANRFNSDFAEEVIPALQIEVAAVRHDPGRSLSEPLACLLDLAEAEALTDLGEQPSAAKLVGPYL